MDDQKIRYEQVLVKNLPAFADRYIKSAEPGAYIAITQHRADAMADNPMAAPDDVGMMVAYAGDVLVGYFGIMPITLHHEGLNYKIHWFTTWSVSAKVRGQGVGSGLMKAALALNKDFMIVGSAPARRVCEKFGFEELGNLKIAKLDLNWKADVSNSIYLLRAARKVANLFGGKFDIHERVEAIRNQKINNQGARIKADAFQELIHDVGEPPEALVIKTVPQVRPLGLPNSNEPATASFHRDEKVINWMLSMPWVLPSGQSASEGLDYYFTDSRGAFEYIVWEIHDEQTDTETYSGYIVFQILEIGQRRVMRVLDVDVLSTRWVLPLALKLGKEKNVDLIEMNARYASSIARSPAHSTRERIYQCYFEHETSPLAKAWQQIVLDMPDGDMAFT